MTIQLLIILIAAHLLVDSFNDKIHDQSNINPPLLKSSLFVISSTILTIFFSLFTIATIFAVFIISILYYICILVCEKINPVNESDIKQYLMYQGSQILIIYFTLYVLGQTVSPAGIMQQLNLLVFSNELNVDEDIKLPSVLLILVFLVSTSADLISKFLGMFNHKNRSHVTMNDEVAASIENDVLLEKTKSIKQNQNRDMLVEEQIDIVDTNNNQKKTESIKIQYHWYHTEQDQSVGKYIGIIERLLICIFVFFGIFHGLLLLGAVKTLARFKLFEDKSFAEYYLVGTLLSLLFGLVCGFLLLRIL